MDNTTIIAIVVVLILLYYFFFMNNTSTSNNKLVSPTPPKLPAPTPPKPPTFNAPTTPPTTPESDSDLDAQGCKLLGNKKLCKQCPTGTSTTGTGKMTAIMTSSGTCRCMNKNYYIEGESCVECPEGSNPDSAGDDTNNVNCKCVTDLHWNDNTKKCESCPNGSNVKGTGKAIPGFTRCKCNTEVHYWKPQLNTCDQCPDGSLVWDPEHPWLKGRHGHWVPHGTDAETTLGQHWGYACKCAWDSRWNDGLKKCVI
jgi:hypothetical protein